MVVGSQYCAPQNTYVSDVFVCGTNFRSPCNPTYPFGPLGHDFGYQLPVSGSREFKRVTLRNAMVRCADGSRRLEFQTQVTV